MVFSLRLPKLSGGHAETPKKILEIPEIFAEISKISEIREMLTLSRDSEHFCRVSGPNFNLTNSFCVRSLRIFHYYIFYFQRRAFLIFRGVF